jgi:FtsH-binding integral membrane protein
MSSSSLELGPYTNLADMFEIRKRSTDDTNFAVKTRLGFLRKVYGIVSAQLLLTTLVSAAFMYTESIRYYLEYSWLGFFLVMFLGFLSLIMVVAMESQKHVYPDNYILLTAFTVCESLLIGIFVTYYTIDSVIKAFAMTCVLTSALTLYALQSRKDLSSRGSSLFAVLLNIVLLSLYNMYMRDALLHLILTYIGAVLFSLYIIYDVNAIMNKVRADEYIMAAATLYLDIVNLFTRILGIFGNRREIE